MAGGKGINLQSADQPVHSVAVYSEFTGGFAQIPADVLSEGTRFLGAVAGADCSLFITQRDARLDARSATCRNVTGEDSRAKQYRRCRAKRCYIGRFHSDQQARDPLPRSKYCGHSDAHPDDNQQQRFAESEPKHTICAAPRAPCEFQSHWYGP